MLEDMDHLTPYIQARLCETLLTLLESEISQTSLTNFAHCLFILDLYKEEIPRNLLNEFHTILNKYIKLGDEGSITYRYHGLSDEQMMELTEQLLSLYIEINGGNLIL
jgi:hypothetical protein